MSRHSSGSKRHQIQRFGSDDYRISWVVDHHYSGSRLLFSRRHSRDTNRKGAERFAKKWGVKMPAEPGPPAKKSPEVCPRCLPLAGFGHIRAETIQPLPEGAKAPLAMDGSGNCCYDCAAADGLLKQMRSMGFIAARICVGNDRQEQYRLPGVPMGLVQSGLVRPSEAGDFERHLAWLDANNWFGLREDPE